MSSCRLLIETGSKPNRLRIGVVGEPPTERPFFSIHLSKFGDVREDPFWCTALNPEQVGSLLSQEVENIRDGHMYCAYICSNETYQFGISPNLDKLVFKQYFRVTGSQVFLLSESKGKAERDRQIAQNLSPLFAEDGHGPNADRFEVVIFFAGVNLHFPSAMKGVSLIPVTPGLSNSSMFEAVSAYLLERHSVNIPDGTSLKDWLRYQPVFAIDFHQIVAATETSAFRFATNIAHDFSTIIASERGDKPFSLLSFILDIKKGTWQIVPTNFDLRGNLLPPMFQNVNAERIEWLFPIVQSRSYARLVLELYVQSLMERDKSFRFFRQWSVLEMIADKRIASSDAPLLNLDGSNIYLSSGKPLTTSRKEGKVYAYLRCAELPAIYQGMENGTTRVLEGSLGSIDQGGGLVSLWEAVAASYKIRNDVAHDGRFDANKRPTGDRDLLCIDFYTGQFGFLEHALDHAVWRELSQEHD